METYKIKRCYWHPFMRQIITSQTESGKIYYALTRDRRFPVLIGKDKTLTVHAENLEEIKTYLKEKGWSHEYTL
jgi:hypothetical protein